MSASDVSGRSALFPEPEGDVAETGEILQDGILPSQDIRELIRKGHIRAYPEIAEQQIQPASLDLRLGDVAYRVQASFLPRRATVEQIIQDLQLRMVRVDHAAAMTHDTAQPIHRPTKARAGVNGASSIAGLAPARASARCGTAPRSCRTCGKAR